MAITADIVDRNLRLNVSEPDSVTKNQGTVQKLGIFGFYKTESSVIGSNFCISGGFWCMCDFSCK
jgi:hypothetical protein